MTIIKKSGKREEFSPEKLSASIAAASDVARQPLNQSDLHGILVEFNQIVQGKNLITTQQIDVIVYGLLYARKYHKVLEEYASFAKKR